MPFFAVTKRHAINDTIRTETLEAESEEQARRRAQDGGWIVEEIEAEEAEDGGGDSPANTEGESVPHNEGQGANPPGFFPAQGEQDSTAAETEQPGNVEEGSTEVSENGNPG